MSGSTFISVISRMIDLAQTGDFSDSYPFRNFRSVSLPAYEPTGKDFVDLIGHDQFYAYT